MVMMGVAKGVVMVMMGCSHENDGVPIVVIGVIIMVGEKKNYLDGVLTDEAHQTTGAISNGEGAVILLVSGGLAPIIAIMGP